MMTTLPENGISEEEILEKINSYKSNDVEWKEGKSFCLSYYGGREAYEIGTKVGAQFMSTNALNPMAFPSLKKMENEIVSMVRSVIGGSRENTGSLTSGGTESILLAVKTAKNWAKKNLKHAKKPEMILPTTAHPAFLKAADYFGVKPILVEVDNESFKPKVDSFREKITKNTILLVVSAPGYPHGVIDPIEGVAKLAKKNGLLCHVDACIGGWILGFYSLLGLNDQAFDLKVDGVTSISCDLHKYGFTPKGASVLLYKDKSLRRFQFYCTTQWPGGVYISPTIMGTRPGAPIASAWAILNYFGLNGYKKVFKKIYETTQKYHRTINAIDGIETIVDKPESSILAICSKAVNIFVVGDYLHQRGWIFDKNSVPPSIHLSIMPNHLEVMDGFVEDLKWALEQAKSHNFKDSWGSAITNSVAKVMPTSLLRKIAKKQTARLNSEDTSPKTAAIYGLANTLDKKGALKDIALDLLDQMYDQS